MQTAAKDIFSKQDKKLLSTCSIVGVQCVQDRMDGPEPKHANK